LGLLPYQGILCNPDVSACAPVGLPSLMSVIVTVMVPASKGFQFTCLEGIINV